MGSILCNNYIHIDIRSKWRSWTKRSERRHGISRIYGTNGERGQKGNHTNRMIPLAGYDVSVGDKGDSGQRGDPGDRGPRGLVGKIHHV